MAQALIGQQLLFSGTASHRGRQTSVFPGNSSLRHLFYGRILLDGTVRLYKIYGGHKEATVALLKDRGVFGELGLGEGSRQSAFAEARARLRSPAPVESVHSRSDIGLEMWETLSIATSALKLRKEMRAWDDGPRAGWT